MTQNNWWPGSTVTTLFMDEIEVDLRAHCHRVTALWIHSASEVHYVMQCLPFIDQHRVLAMFGNRELAQLVRNTLDSQREVYNFDQEYRTGMRELLSGMGLIPKEAA